MFLREEDVVGGGKYACIGTLEGVGERERESAPLEKTKEWWFVCFQKHTNQGKINRGFRGQPA